MKKKHKRRLLRLGVLLGSLFLGLLLCEGIVRIAGIGGTTLTRGRLHTYDPNAGWTGLPGLDTRYMLPNSFDVRIVNNSRGLRGGEHTIAKPEGVRRVVVLGDSFMWGFGVENEEMLATVLERELPKTESINLGSNGYSTVQQLVRLETEGMQYAPDWTVLAFTWNDLGDNFDDKKGGRPAVKLAPDGSVEVTNRPVRRRWKAPVKQWLRHNSRLFAFGEYCAELLKMKRREQEAKSRAAEAASSEQPAGPSLAAAMQERAGGLDYTLIDVYARSSPDMDRGWAAFAGLLKQTRDLATRDGGRLLVVYNAAKEAVTKQAFTDAFGEKLLADPKLAIDWDRPADRLSEVCKGLDVAYLDLTPEFRRQEEPFKRLFLHNNGHWSAEGHALAGKLVAAKIAVLEQDQTPPR